MIIQIFNRTIARGFFYIINKKSFFEGYYMIKYGWGDQIYNKTLLDLGI